MGSGIFSGAASVVLSVFSSFFSGVLDACLRYNCPKRARRNTCTPMKQRANSNVSQNIPKAEEINKVFIRKVYIFFIVTN